MTKTYKVSSLQLMLSIMEFGSKDTPIPMGLLYKNHLHNAFYVKAIKGDALNYFMESIAPHIAPCSFHHFKSEIEEYLFTRRNTYYKNKTSTLSFTNTADLMMDGVEFIIRKEYELIGQN